MYNKVLRNDPRNIWATNGIGITKCHLDFQYFQLFFSVFLILPIEYVFREAGFEMKNVFIFFIVMAITDNQVCFFIVMAITDNQVWWGGIKLSEGLENWSSFFI